MNGPLHITPFVSRLLGLDSYILLPEQCRIEAEKWVIAIMPTAKVEKCLRPECGSMRLKPHTPYTHRVVHVPVGAKRTVLEIVVPRWLCKVCKLPSSAPQPGVADECNATEDSIAFWLDQYQSRLPFVQIAFATGTNENTVGRVIRKRIDAIDKVRRNVLPESIVVDEIRVHRGADGLWTHFTNPATGDTIDLLAGTSAETLQHFLGRQDDVSALTRYCTDGAPGFIDAMRRNFPEAEGALDRFHVIQHLTDALTKLRGLAAKEGDAKALCTDGPVTEPEDASASSSDGEENPA